MVVAPVLAPLGSPVSVFLLAENRLLREALIRMLSKKDDISIAGSGAYSPQVFEQILAAAPRVVVLDSVFRALSQDRIIYRLHQARPEIGMVMVGMEADEAIFLRLVREGVLGYVLTDASAAEVSNAIRCVAAGGAVCPPALSVALFRCAANSQESLPGVRLKTDPDFSPRQRQLVQLIRDGLSNKEVAARLNLSEQTVKNHVHRMLRKVGAADRLSMVQLSHSEEDAAPN